MNKIIFYSTFYFSKKTLLLLLSNTNTRNDTDKQYREEILELVHISFSVCRLLDLKTVTSSLMAAHVTVIVEGNFVPLTFGLCTKWVKGCMNSGY